MSTIFAAVPMIIDADLAHHLMEIEEEHDPSTNEGQDPTMIEGSRGSIHCGGEFLHSSIRSFRSNVD